MQFTEIMMTAFVNFFSDKLPIIIIGITAAVIIAAGPAIAHYGYAKVSEWFEPEKDQKFISVVRNGKAYQLPMEMRQRLEEQGYVVSSPYENLDLHPSDRIYMSLKEFKDDHPDYIDALDHANSYDGNIDYIDQYDAYQDNEIDEDGQERNMNEDVYYNEHSRYYIKY